MIGIYFSGTGNTRHCIEKFVHEMDADAKCISMEHKNAMKAIAQSDFIVLAYPIYFSNLPKIVRDFLETNSSSFSGKKVFVIATMGLFSGDGSGCAARLLKKYGAEVVGGLHIKMPDCIGDEKLLKKTKEQNSVIVKQAEEKCTKAIQALKSGRPSQEGLSFLHLIAGLFGQRLWFYNKTKDYSSKLKISSEKCVGCGVCVKLCPMSNLSVENQVAKHHNKCTMCYRCISYCPSRAMTLLGSTLYEQCRIENYL